jgi:UDP-glucose 4-epimerase
MKVVVTGGAGYIGAHIAKVFIDNGDEVLVIDDLTNSDSRRVDSLKAKLLKISINDADGVFHALENADLVVHCAAYKSVEESEMNPQKYEKANLAGTENLLVQMVKAKVKKIIFASTAAVYGNSVSSPISENSIPVPISIYGKTKLEAEILISNFCKTYDLSAVSLRFFNAVGAETKDLVDTSKDNLFPKVFEAISSGKSPDIYGNDYPTPDGTCIRDYIHVQDIAEAHLAAATYLENHFGHTIFNVGTGKGYSVKEIISGIQQVTGTNFESNILPRRKGDLDIAFADVSFLEKETNWKARFGLREMITSAWSAWQADKK